MASSNDNLDMSLVFYGTGPTDASAYANVSAPVYGFYAANDESVNATIPMSTNAMADAGKTYEIEMYDGAGHAFMHTAAKTRTAKRPTSPRATPRGNA